MKFLKVSIHIILLALLAACSNTKYLQEGQYLYLGAKVNIENDSISKKSRSKLEDELTSLTRPLPNRKTLGMRLRLYAYNFAGNPKKEKSLAGRLKYKFGEPPVLLNQVNLDYNTAILDNYLENNGFFDVTTTADTVIKGKKATAVYTVAAGKPYSINEVVYETDESFIGLSVQQAQYGSILRKGEAYSLDRIKTERERIDAYLKQNGFFFFNPEYLSIDVDSSIGNRQVNYFLKIKPTTPTEAKQMYTIKDTYVYSDYRLNTGYSDTSTKNAVLYNGITIIDRTRNYKPRIFDQTLQFESGDVYSRNDHNLSLNRLINLGIFKFVKNRFVIDSNYAQARLNTYYYLTPMPKKSLRLELNGTTKSNNLVGSQLSLSWRNRNTFKGGELLTISALGGAEVQYGSRLKGYNTYRGGLETSLSIPRVIVPFFKFNTSSAFVPKTNIMLAYDFLRKEKLYTLSSFRTSYGYNWKENIYKEHQLNPISINYVLPSSVSPEYQAAADTVYTLRKNIERQFVLGSTYNYTYNQAIDGFKTNTFYFSGTADVSGNLFGALFGRGNSFDNPHTIFGNAYAQYVKLEADFRYYRKLSENTILANRIILGGALPYGNSREVPFIKQFFIGGNNSIRAFRTRSIGPGTYDGTQYELFPDQSGDIKLEFNTELRAKLFSVVHGAVFVDAGNIWLYRDNPEKPGANFTKNFLRELAIGTGVGIRIDVSILVLRLDVAFPVRKPWLEDGKRWIFNTIDLGDKQWRRDNLILNLGIGYPF
jgi:outer membrane protein insertion porin family